MGTLRFIASCFVLMVELYKNVYVRNDGILFKHATVVLKKVIKCIINVKAGRTSSSKAHSNLSEDFMSFSILIITPFYITLSFSITFSCRSQSGRRHRL